MASGSGNGNTPDLPRGLIDRRGAPAGKARLTSYRSPRDLTLGGMPKRVFVPNIPVRKEKSARVAEPEVKKPESKPREKKSERGHGRGGRGGRGRGRGESNLVQISSVFEQGPSMQKITSHQSGYSFGETSGGGGGGGGGSGGRGAADRSFVKALKSEHGFTDKEKPGRFNLMQLLSDDFIEDSEGADPGLECVGLPKIENLSVKKEVKKEEPQPGPTSFIKKEPEEDMDSNVNDDKDIDFDDILPTQQRPCSKIGVSCADVFDKAAKSGKEEIILFQLPHILPGVPPMTEEEQVAEAATKDSKDKKTDAEEEEEGPSKYSLRCFQEGYLGKLRIRKSGKVELVLGDHVLDVDMGVPSTQLREVVSVHTEEDDKRMVMLGHVKHKMIVTPNIPALLAATCNEESKRV